MGSRGDARALDASPTTPDRSSTAHSVRSLTPRVIGPKLTETHTEGKNLLSLKRRNGGETTSHEPPIDKPFVFHGARPETRKHARDNSQHRLREV
jgi:hypothetical protein